MQQQQWSLLKPLSVRGCLLGVMLVDPQNTRLITHTCTHSGLGERRRWLATWGTRPICTTMRR